MENLEDFTTIKPWGHEIRFAQNDKYLGKILYIKKDVSTFKTVS